jgi:prepilin-type N-terminal cleavage/methylation domain-containing protein
MTRRGFTLIELATVLAISSLVVPGGYLLLRSLEKGHETALAKLSAAAAARTVSEQIRLDSRTRQLAPDGVELQGAGPCGAVSFRAAEGRLDRVADSACGGTSALAAHVTGLERVPGGVALTFSRETGPGAAATDRFLVGLPTAQVQP